MTKTMNQASLNSRVVLKIIKLARLPNYIHVILHVYIYTYICILYLTYYTLYYVCHLQPDSFKIEILNTSTSHVLVGVRVHVGSRLLSRLPR